MNLGNAANKCRNLFPPFFSELIFDLKWYRKGQAKKQPTWRVFSLKELHSATNNFNYDNKLGEGGFGSVYWGQLWDGSQVIHIYNVECLIAYCFKLKIALYVLLTKGSPVHNAFCVHARPGEGPHAKGCADISDSFHISNPWPIGHMVTTQRCFASRLPFSLLTDWSNYMKNSVELLEHYWYTWVNSYRFDLKVAINCPYKSWIVVIHLDLGILEESFQGSWSWVCDCTYDCWWYNRFQDLAFKEMNLEDHSLGCSYLLFHGRHFEKRFRKTFNSFLVGKLYNLCIVRSNPATSFFGMGRSVGLNERASSKLLTAFWAPPKWTGRRDRQEFTFFTWGNLDY